MLSQSDYLTRLEQANVVNSLDNLMTFPRLRKLIETERVAIHGAYFGVSTGRLSVRDATGAIQADRGGRPRAAVRAAEVLMR